MPEEYIYALKAVATAFASVTQPFTITFDRFCTFGGGDGDGDGTRPLVLTQGEEDNSELMSLQAVIVEVTRNLIQTAQKVTVPTPPSFMASMHFMMCPWSQ